MFFFVQYIDSTKRNIFFLYNMHVLCLYASYFKEGKLVENKEKRKENIVLPEKEFFKKAIFELVEEIDNSYILNQILRFIRNVVRGGVKKNLKLIFIIFTYSVWGLFAPRFFIFVFKDFLCNLY